MSRADATVTEYDPLNSIVVCQHSNHRIAAAGVRHAGGGFRSQRNERFDLCACPIVDGHIRPAFKGFSVIPAPICPNPMTLTLMATPLLDTVH